MLRPIIIGVVIGIIMLTMIYVADVVIGILISLNDIISTATNTTKETGYSSIANSYVSAIVWVVLLIIAGALLVYGIHIKKR